MILTLKRTVKATMLGLGLMAASANQVDAGLILSVNAAGVQASTVSGVTTETFSDPAGVYTNISNQPSAVGTFTSPGIAIVNANQYGGAGGTGQYLAIGSESGSLSATLTLSGSESYFGFWWSAADSLNSVDLYSKGNLIASLSSASALAALGSSYNGNPNGTGDSGEKFAYLNFTGTNGTTIDQVVFKNASLVTGFEADNFSIDSAPTAVAGTIINNALTVPEPSSIVLASIGGLIGTGSWLRRNRRRAIVKA